MMLPLALTRYRCQIDQELKEALAAGPSPCYRLLGYHLGWLDSQGRPQASPGGKALRPALCLLACQAVGGEMSRALPGAAALELIHEFSLIHDDIQDGDVERRHRPTLWSLWGQPRALNAGDAMRILAGLALERLGGRGVPAPGQLRAAFLLDQSCLEMIEGQYLDISYETRLDITPQAYLDMVDRKTAALFSCALHLGALLGARDEALAQPFRDYGRKLGLAFQIRDDILGIWGREEATGKPFGNDIRRRKKSYPVVVALAAARGAAAEELISLYRREGVEEAQVARVIQLLEGLGARECAQEKARELKEGALQELEGAPLPAWARAELQEISAFLVEREF